MCTDAAITVDISAYKKAINLEFCNLCFTVSSKKGDTQKNILKNVSGNFKAGRLAAILGPSGAGKTSLLNILSGLRKTGVTGTITVNGEKRDKNDFRKKSAYIPQEFAMLNKLTALETLCIAADLKLPSNIASIAKRKVVNDVVHILNLSKCLNTRVENLSGGERKRLSIGVELLTNPPIMFFDEPTSGLDSCSSVQVVTHLREMARSGRNIICVIHQPASRLLELFDDLFILSNGQCIYNGTLEDMVPKFKEAGFDCPSFYNRADFALEVASLERYGSVERLIEMSSKSKEEIAEEEDISNSDENSRILAHPNVILNNISETPFDMPIKDSHQPRQVVRQYPISEWKQFFILTKRSLLCTVRDFYYAQLRVICHILVGLMLGTVFFDIGNDANKLKSNVSCLFFFSMFIFFSNSMPTVLTFPLETSVFLREHLNNWYSLGAYYFSKLIADLPLQIMCPVLFVLIAYFMTGQPNENSRFLMLGLICLLTAILAQSFGLVAGAAFNIQLGIFLVPALNIPMMIFSGFFIQFNELLPGFRPLTYLSYFRYSFEGSGEKFLDNIDMGGDQYWTDVAGLCVWIVLLHILLFSILKLKLIRAQ